MTGFVIRSFLPGDLRAALALQRLSYAPGLRDSEAAFASRLRVGAGCCWVADQAGRLSGYILAHPWPSGKPPAVDTVLTAPASDAEWVHYIHDLSVSSAATGAGLGRRLVEHAAAAARRDGLRRAELVAVPGAAGFWGHIGFQTVPVTTSLADKLRSYGREAVYMARAL